MNPITAQEFQDILTQLESMESEAAMEPLIDRFGEEQTLLATFLDEMGGEDLNDDEHEVKFFYGVAIWQTLERYTEQSLAAVTEETLETLRQKSENHIETLTGEHGNISVEEVSATLKDHPQETLLNEIFETVIVDEADFVRQKNLGDLLMYLKMALDALLPE